MILVCFRIVLVRSFLGCTKRFAKALFMRSIRCNGGLGCRRGIGWCGLVLGRFTIGLIILSSIAFLVINFF